ncbi:MAG: Acyl-CoA dehydrogenase, long-chain specific, partial [uncultured Sphingomonadaceae bacterium]
WPIETISARRCAPGWRRTARQKCASRSSTKATPAGAGATRRSRTPRRSSGWRSWARAAGPCPTGQRNMAAAGCRRRRPRSCGRRWPASARATRCTASAFRCSGRRCC